MTHDSDIPTQAADLQAFFDGELDAAAAERMAPLDRDRRAAPAHGPDGAHA